ncbi:MAG: hypothetical protein KGL26_05360 [Pseudomonadota bacterium]|nr:hypothetical protein [Pseudomonadota bacterium]
MPIKIAIENQGDLRLAVYRYSGHVRLDEVPDSITRAVSQFAPNQPFRELLIFEHDSDLSDFDPTSLEAVYRACAELYRRLQLGLRTAAAMLDESMDAKIIMPLFNALSLASGGPDLGFKLFTDIEPALKWLGVPTKEGLKIIARAA